MPIGASIDTITPQRLEKFKRVLSYRQPDLTLVLANIHDRHNVSAIHRSADAFGVQGIHLYYTTTAFPCLGSKCSASAKKWVETYRHTTIEDLSESMRQGGFQVLATSCSSQSKELRCYDLTRPTAFIMGNEHSGVPSDLLSIADGEVYIPMLGMIQSFNVSVAAALLLYEAHRQRFDAGLYDSPRYSEEELKKRLQEWIEK